MSVTHGYFIEFEFGGLEFILVVKGKNKAMARCFVAIIAVLVLALLTPPIATANPITVSKDKGRYSDTLQLDGGDVNAELYFEWWTLFDQFVYYHKFKWETQQIRFRHDNRWKFMSADHGATPNLAKHADLLSRFKDLRPSNIEISLLVQMSPSDKLNDFAANQHCYAFERETVFKVDLERSPHLMIAKAGRWGDNITPASPQSWADMFEQSGTRCRLQSDIRGTDVDERMTRTFGISDQMRVSGRLSNIEWPETAILSIYEAYLEREKEEEEKDEDEAREKGNSDAADSDDDFWNGGEDAAKSTQPSSSAAVEAASDCDFFTGGCEPETEASNDSFFSGESSARSLNGKISRKDGKQGVLGSDGQVIIPFRNWNVKSYSRGMASIEEYKTVKCRANPTYDQEVRERREKERRAAEAARRRKEAARRRAAERRANCRRNGYDCQEQLSVTFGNTDEGPPPIPTHIGERIKLSYLIDQTGRKIGKVDRETISTRVSCKPS